MADLEDGLVTARMQVERVFGLLVSPTPPTLDFCSGLLLAAVHGVASCLPTLSETRQRSERLAEALQLRAAIARAGGLLQSAWDYHAKWRRIVGAMSAGYTSRGDAAAIEQPGRVCLQG